MMTVRCMLRHVCKLGFTSTTACTVAASLRTNTVCKRQSNQRLTDSAQSWQVEKGSQTWTAAGLMERQPLMLRLLRWRSFRAHAAMEASVSLRQQCRPRDLNALQFSATATTPMSCTCRTFCSALHTEEKTKPVFNSSDWRYMSSERAGLQSSSVRRALILPTCQKATQPSMLWSAQESSNVH